jgi:hypothetical protein
MPDFDPDDTSAQRPNGRAKQWNARATCWLDAHPWWSAAIVVIAIAVGQMVGTWIVDPDSLMQAALVAAIGFVPLLLVVHWLQDQPWFRHRRRHTISVNSSARRASAGTPSARNANIESSLVPAVKRA